MISTAIVKYFMLVRYQAIFFKASVWFGCINWIAECDV